MDVAFKDESLDRLEIDASFSAGFGNAVVKAYRKRMQQIRAARDERTFYAFRSLRFEKLHGDREGQFSMRLSDQWRLIRGASWRGSKEDYPCHRNRRLSLARGEKKCSLVSLQRFSRRGSLSVRS